MPLTLRPKPRCPPYFLGPLLYLAGHMALVVWLPLWPGFLLSIPSAYLLGRLCVRAGKMTAAWEWHYKVTPEAERLAALPSDERMKALLLAPPRKRSRIPYSFLALGVVSPFLPALPGTPLDGHLAQVILGTACLTLFALSFKALRR